MYKPASFLIGFYCFFVHINTLSQTTVPGVIDPGRVKQRLEVPATEEPRPETPQTRAPDLVAPEEAKQITFTLKRI